MSATATADLQRPSVRLLERLRRDPEYFCREILGVEPWRKQIEVLKALRDRDRVAVRSGHGTGKSFIAAASALWFLYSHYPAKVITTAPTWNQVRHILWNELRRLHAGARVPLGGTVLEERIKLAPDAFAIGLSTDEPERLQGFHAEHVLVILDEAPGVREELWHAAETLLTGRVGKILAIGNPTRPAGLFYEAFRPGSTWTTVHISCLDSPNVATAKDGTLRFPRLVTPRWIADRAAEWGTTSALWKSRVLGEFPDDDLSLLFPRTWLERAASPLGTLDDDRSPSQPDRPASPLSLPASGSADPRLADAAAAGSAPPDPAADALSVWEQSGVRIDRAAPEAPGLRLGVDVARQGTDATVLLLRDETGVLSIEAHRGWSTMETAGRVVRLMEEHALPAERVYVDDTGLGAGVTDRLRELGHDVTAVLASSRASDPQHYANRRAECYWRLRRRCDPDTGLPAFGIPARFSDLHRELAALTFHYTSAGQIRIDDKVELRGRLGSSPDCADALALTFAPDAADSQPCVMIF